MKPNRWLGLAVLATTVSSLAGYARGPERHNVDEIAGVGTVPVQHRRLHTAGNVRMTMANNGTFGSEHGGLTADPTPFGQDAYHEAASFEYPRGSRLDYLYIGSLWVGGIVGGDTLVSEGVKPDSKQMFEFSGFQPILLTYDSVLGRQDFTCCYYDTAIGPSSQDEEEPRTHLPMGLRVTQVSHAWQSAPYDRFVIAKFTITNIDTMTIRDACVGIFADDDVYWQQREGTKPRYDDDLSGYLRAEGIAYTIDNDGDPFRDSTWDSASVRGAFGIAPVLLDPPACCTTFNWWNQASQHVMNWGPHVPTEIRDGSPGIPPGDRSCYNTMRNGEVDYDQLWAAIDKSKDGWTRPPAPVYSTDIANGGDTRFLLSFGKYNLAPGDSVRMVVAFVAGDSVHQHPDDFAAYFNPQDPQVFYDRLDFRDLTANVERARRFYLTGRELYGAAPVHIWCSPAADQAARINWTVAPFDAVAMYRLYRRNAVESAWTAVSDILPSLAPVAEDGRLSLGTTYEYAVTVIDTGGIESPPSRSAAITIGAPPAIPTLNADAGLSQITINWTLPNWEPQFSPPQYLNLYRRAEQDSQPSLIKRLRLPMTGRINKPIGTRIPVHHASSSAAAGIVDSAAASPYVDRDIVTGTTYYYSASLANALDIEGRRSPEDTSLSMAFDRQGIVIMHCTESRELINPDSVRAFYGEWAKRNDFDTVLLRSLEVIGGGPPYGCITMHDLSHYRLVIYASEGGNFCGPALSQWLVTYLSHGGRCIFVARSSITNDFPPFPFEMLGYAATVIEKGLFYDSLHNVMMSLIFKGARSARRNYPRTGFITVLG